MKEVQGYKFSGLTVKYDKKILNGVKHIVIMLQNTATQTITYDSINVIPIYKSFKTVGF